HGCEQWSRSGRQAVGHAILPRNRTKESGAKGITSRNCRRNRRTTGSPPPTRAWSHDGLVPDIVRDRPAGPKKNRTLAGPVVVRRRGGRPSPSRGEQLPEISDCNLGGWATGRRQ